MKRKTNTKTDRSKFDKNGCETKERVSKSKTSRNDREPQDNIRKPQSLDKAGRDNDPNWYIDDKVLAEQVCHLSFNSFVGEGNVIGTKYQVPSIVRFATNPSPFNSYDIIDPNDYVQITRSGLNLAITQLYTLLASYSGRAASYAPQDVGAIVLAMGEIVSCIEDLRRVIGVSYTFSERNRALPKLLTHALGYDYDDLIRNRSIYVSRLNAIITRFNSLPILGNVAYILKCRDIYQKVYADSVSPEATILCQTPMTTWTLDETSYSGGTILKTTVWTPSYGYDTFGNHLTTLNNMVEALFGSTTLNVIYADLLNLASKVKVDMFKLDYVTEDYIVLPEYNENFLMQMHNADILGAPAGATFGILYGTMYSTPANDVYPDPNNNGLIYNPVWNYSTTSGNTRHWTSVLDLPVADPTVENIIEATRYKALSTAKYNTDDTVYAALPDHYITEMVTWTSTNACDVKKSMATNWLPDSYDGYTLGMVAALSQIDWAPFVYRQDITNSGNPVQTLFGDLNFFTNMLPQTLMSMNRIIAQDLFKFRM